MFLTGFCFRCGFAPARCGSMSGKARFAPRAGAVLGSAYTEMFGLIAESYIYGDLRIVKTCGEERDGITKLVISFSQIGGEDPDEKDMVKIAQMLGIDMSKDVERYTNTSYDPYFRHTFYFEQVVDDANLMVAKGTVMPA